MCFENKNLGRICNFPVRKNSFLTVANIGAAVLTPEWQLGILRPDVDLTFWEHQDLEAASEAVSENGTVKFFFIVLGHFS